MRLNSPAFRTALLTAALVAAGSNAFAKISHKEDYTKGGGIQVGYATDTCDNTIYGALRFNSSTSTLSACLTAGWTQIAIGAAGAASLGTLTAATATNTINNAAYLQAWQWNTLGSGTAFALSSSSTAAASNSQTLFNLSLSGANATSTQTTYDAYLTNSHTGTSSTNVGLYASATGGANNYAALFANGSVGIGTTTPGALLDLGNAGTVLGNMRFEGNTSGYVQIQPAAAAGSWTMTLPTGGGTNGYFLRTDGSGVTNWAAASGVSGNLGTSVTAASPLRSGDATTGFFTPGANTVSVATGGVETARFTKLASATQYLNIQGGTASAPPTITNNGTATNGIESLGIAVWAGNASAAGVGGRISLAGGAGYGTGSGGLAGLYGGTGGATGTGGQIDIAAGSGGSTSGAGGLVNVQAGNATSGSGGAAQIWAGNAGGTNQSGGLVSITGGDSTGTANGGTASVVGGKGGTSGGAGGRVFIDAGAPRTSGPGGDVLIEGSDGVGTNKAGGSIMLLPGDSTGSAENGEVMVNTTTPAGWNGSGLTVKGGIFSETGQFVSDDGSAYGNYNFGYSTAGVYGYGYGDTTDFVQLFANNTSVLRANADGTAGFYTDVPGSAFQVYSNDTNGGDDSINLTSLYDDPSSFWGTGMISFNLSGTYGNGYYTGADGANNGASGMAGTIDGSLVFFSVPSTGTTSQSITAANAVTDIQMILDNTGHLGINTNGYNSPTAALDVENGSTKLGAAGTPFSAMGVCTVASYTPTTTVANKTCTGVPASTAVVVTCSASAALTTPGTNGIYARANGTADKIAVNTTVANSVAVSLTCMWVQP